MKDVLIGTTNPSKIDRFTRLLAGSGARLLTPADLGVTAVPEENGATPAENAAIKARFYSAYCDRVLCNDSGLYIQELSPDDPRQPGMRVRSPQGRRLDDDQMIAYYAALARSLGGRMTAYYLDGEAVYNQGAIHTFMDEEYARSGSFYMLDRPHPARRPGWPLDSLSVHKRTGAYFVENVPDDGEQDHVIQAAYWQKLHRFLCGGGEVKRAF